MSKLVFIRESRQRDECDSLNVEGRLSTKPIPSSAASWNQRALLNVLEGMETGAGYRCPNRLDTTAR
jgi:hypothetical protein